MPIKQRVPKLKGFNNPFRIEYQAINLDILEATAAEQYGVSRDHPGDAARARPRPQGRPGQGAGPGRDHPRRAACRPTPSPRQPKPPSPPQGVASRCCPCPTGRAVLRPRATSSPTADLSSPAPPPKEPCVLTTLKNVFRIHDLRGKILFTLLMVVLYRLGAHIPVPGRRLPGHQAAPERGRAPGHHRLPEPLLGRRAQPVRHLRPRDHAVHHGVDHHPDPRRGDPEAGGVAEPGRSRPAQDHPVDALPHDRHRPAPGHRADVRLRPGRCQHRLLRPGRRRTSSCCPASRCRGCCS